MLTHPMERQAELQRYSMLSGIVSSVFSAVAAIAVVPIYLRYLGQEAYGVIGFCITLQLLLGVFDLGFSATANREIAQAHERNEVFSASQMAFSLTRLYWGVGAAIAVLVALSASWLSGRWLNVKTLPISEVSMAVALAGLSLGVRWPVVIYQAILLGAHRMLTCSVVTIVMTFLTMFGSVVLIVFCGAGLRGLFAWHAASGLLFALWLRVEVIRILDIDARGNFDLRLIHKAWRLSASLGVIGVIALILVQMDKLILSRMLPLQAYGQYMLATLAASGLYTLVAPIFNAVYPRLSLLIARHESSDLTSTYRSASALLASLLFPLAAFLTLTGRSLVQLWTGNVQLAEAVSPILALLSIGSALHGVMFMPYALALAFGASALMLRIHVVLLLAFAPLIAAMTAWQGGIGAAWAWGTLHAAYLLVGGVYVHQRLLPQITQIWLLKDVCIPGAISLLIAMAGYGLMNWVAGSPLLNAAIGLAIMSATWGILLGRRSTRLLWLWRAYPR